MWAMASRESGALAQVSSAELQHKCIELHRPAGAEGARSHLFIDASQDKTVGRDGVSGQSDPNAAISTTDSFGLASIPKDSHQGAVSNTFGDSAFNTYAIEDGYSDSDNFPKYITIWPDTDCEGEPCVKAAHELWPTAPGDDDGLSDDEHDDVPAELTVYPATDIEGEPQVKKAHELWPMAAARRLKTGPARHRRKAPAGCAGVANELVACTFSPSSPDGGRTLVDGRLKGDMAEFTPAKIAAQSRPTFVAEGDTPDEEATFTTLAVRNLPTFVTQSDFLEEVNQSGFANTYDFAYLPQKRKGHAFVNFKSKETALSFFAAWDGSSRFGVDPEAPALSVARSSMQGFTANTAKWTPGRLRLVSVAPFIASCAEAEEPGPRDFQGNVNTHVRSFKRTNSHESFMSDVTTLTVRNLPPTTTKAEFLKHLDCSGFDGKYDFAYLPLEFHTGLGNGHAFVNFLNANAAKEFVAMWNGSMYFGMSFGDKPLSIVPAAVQGYQANAASWTRARFAKVKNPKFLPFMLPGLGGGVRGVEPWA